MKTIFRLCAAIVIVGRSSLASGQSQFTPLAPAPDEREVPGHHFVDKTNLRLQGINIFSQTVVAIQSQDHGGGMARCAVTPCTGALEARGRTLDPFEKHFESYGYGWAAVYRYGGGVGLNLGIAYLFHATGHHKLGRWLPVVGIAHANASIGYALTGSRQGRYGW